MEVLELKVNLKWKHNLNVVLVLEILLECWFQKPVEVYIVYDAKSSWEQAITW